MASRDTKDGLAGDNFAKALSAASFSIVGKTRAAPTTSEESRRRTTSFAQTQEGVKAKELRAKVAREDRRACLEAPHRYVITTLSMALGLTEFQVEEQILDNLEGLNTMDDFFRPQGRKSMLFYYQKADAPGIECGRHLVRGTRIEQIVIPDGSIPLEGTGFCFFRHSANSQITMENIAREIHFEKVGASSSVLAAVGKYMTTTQCAALRQQAKRTPNVTYLNSLCASMDRFEAFLKASTKNFDERIILKQDNPLTDRLIKINDVREAAKHTDIIRGTEELASAWYKQIEYVLKEGAQIRRQADDSGPHTELEHWRRLATRYNDIVEQLKALPVQAVRRLLSHCKNKLVEMLQIIETKVTHAAMLCRDNMKHLYSLQDLYRPLYSPSPEVMKDALPKLISSIRLVNTASTHDNTTELITPLLIKISNQMVNSCRQFITDAGKSPIWEQPNKTLVDKLKKCIALYEVYKEIIQKSKKKSKTHIYEKPLLFSERHIFGKFEAFCKRLKKIINILDTVDNLSVLVRSKMEGIDAFAGKFTFIFNSVKRKSYDFLDHKKTEFDNDYESFLSQITVLEDSLQAFFTTTFTCVASTFQALQQLERIGNLNLRCVKLSNYYMTIVTRFTDEVQEAKLLVETVQENPLRMLPPVSGKIRWYRRICRKIQDNMDCIHKNYPDLLKLPEAEKLNSDSRQLCKALIRRELIEHRSWVGSVEPAWHSLGTAILVKADNKKLIVNFDLFITQTIRETDHMLKMNLAVPSKAKMIFDRRTDLYRTLQNVNCMLEKNESIRAQIPSMFKRLMVGMVHRVDAVIQPGLTSLNWNSLDVPDYLEAVDQSLDELERTTKKVVDMREHNIYSVLTAIEDVLLVDIPDGDPRSTTEFLNNLSVAVKTASQKLDFMTFKVESAVYDLIDVFLKIADVGDMPQPTRAKWIQFMHTTQKKSEREDIRYSLPILADGLTETDSARINQQEISLFSACKTLYLGFSNKSTDALTRVTERALNIMKYRIIQSPSMLQTGPPPFLHVDIVLSAPSVALSPNLIEVQAIVSQAAQMVIEVSQEVILWGQKRPYNPSKRSNQEMDVTALAAKSKLKTYYETIREHEEMRELVMKLQTALTTPRLETSKVLKNYMKYSHLWEGDKVTLLEEFRKSQPTLDDYGQKITGYLELKNEVLAFPPHHQDGPLRLMTSPIMKSLLAEVESWIYAYTNQMHHEYGTKLKELMSFIEEKNFKLNKPIKDLDDVKHAMDALQDIRTNRIEHDILIDTIEEAFVMLKRFNFAIPKKETDGVNSLRVTFEDLLQLSKSVKDHLFQNQAAMGERLTSSIVTFKKELHVFDEEYASGGPMEDGIPAQEASKRLAFFQKRFDELWHDFSMCSSGEALFGWPVTDYPTINNTKKELNLLQKLYTLYNEVTAAIARHHKVVWADLNIEVISTELNDFSNRCRKMPKALQGWPAYSELKKAIDDFNETCPLLEMMSNVSVKQRHWDKIAELTNYTFEPESRDFTLKNALQAPLLKYKDEIEDICVGATKEKDIETKLKGVIAEWSAHELTCAKFKNRGELLLKGQETSEIISFMEDSLMILGSLLSNRYNTHYKKQIQQWVQNLSNTSEILENWMVVQNLWVYLEAVFVGGDIAKQLPLEAEQFANIDKSWVRIMDRAHAVPNVVECCVGEGSNLNQVLPDLLEQLEVCQKSLTGYLESKRLVFPRFFFVSDPALLEILGQASDPHTIQAHLLGIFENVARVEFDSNDYVKIDAVLSREKERIELKKPVRCEGKIEMWLGELLQQQQRSLHGIIRDACSEVKEPNFDLMEFLENFLAQVGLLGIQIIWTKNAEVAIKNARVDRDIMNETNKLFLNMLNSLIDMTTKDLTKVERIKYETLVTIHVHQRDIFDKLVKMRVKSIGDFEWSKQSRFYFDEDEDLCLIKITDIDFIYQNEFMGCTDRLVITPLTDRCYITIAQAVGMSMGSAPAGPAGTGKTETTKDMGKALGKYVVVFNCSDQMDFRGLGRIYKGLAQSGSWGCFDEFNRIELPVLSVAAQQIYIVFSARKQRKTMFVFSDGDNVSLNPEFTIIITMNPGYAGRQELPENLKIQFRTVAMMVPDRQIIMRVKLASCGFRENIILARKFFVLYKLCEEQLSKQVHYDFGLRNILSVLRTLGAQKRSRPEDPEEMVVMNVLRDMNVSKLVDEDEPLFLSLINDLFPGIHLDSIVRADLQSAIANQVQQAKMINHPPWNLKLVQLYETSLVRHGLMTLGPTGAGKTACIHMLMKAMTETGRPHREMRMNPKAITAPQMFGRLDVATNDWTDGIFSTLWRRTHKVKATKNTWLVLDGPVDAVWIENLNSVLDDNKTLTLANGDRITMAPNCKILFEPDNVDNASPATVSRMGMVFMSSSVLGWKPLLKGWLLSRTSSEAETLWNFYDSIFSDLLTYVRQELHEKMFVQEANYITQSINILTGMIMGQDDKVKVGSFSVATLQRFFLFSVMWSLGALLELDMRVRFEQFVLTHPSKLNWPPAKQGETIFEYTVNAQGEWEHWQNYVAEYRYPSDYVPEFASILVPNVDNVRTNFLIGLISKQQKCALLIGEPGTAKTVMIKSFLSSLDPEQHLNKCINFSSTTNPGMYQRTIESYVDKRVGTTYGPPAERKMTVFIDDINMPEINAWGDQVCNEIVRQVMEEGGFYSLDKPGDFSRIVDMQFLAAMIHPGGGRNDIPPRLKRRFAIFNCTLPSNNSMDLIFTLVSSGYFCSSRFNSSVVDFVPKIVPMTRTLWSMTKVKMLPTPANFHYVFNLRDLSRIYEGMLKVTSETIDKPGDVLGLWKHECIRVIADRFTSQADKDWFEQTVLKVARNSLNEDLAECVEATHYYVDFLQDAPELTGEEADDFEAETPHVYEPIPSFEALEDRLRLFQDIYNDEIRGSKLDLVFFVDAMVHLVKISRVLKTPRGNLLLVGVGGSGKQSLARLATKIAGFQTFQITLTRAYNVSNLLDDLKVLYRIAGKEGKGITFLFTDNEVKEENFLEYINNLISTGEISNLFPRDELDEILNELAPVMKKSDPRIPATPDNLYNYFISRARNNIHVCLCFSPVGEKFRSRALKFPGLISGCTMDWFSRWPPDALVAVSHHFISRQQITCTDSAKNEVINSMGMVHDGVAKICVQYFERFRRQTHVTPKSYLAFLEGYKTIYSTKHQHIADLASRMNMGLTKLVEATASVNELAIELEEMKKTLAIASAEAEEVLQEVAISASAAEKVKAEVQVVKDGAQHLVSSIAVAKEIAMKKLAIAKPALEEAERALDTITAADIATVRKLGKPPHLVMRIMDCVLLLFQRRLDPVTADPDRECPKPSWSESQKLMSNTQFLQGLKNYPKDTINDEMCELMEAYFKMDDYNYETAKKVSGNVAGLLSWTLAMKSFFGINKEVLPLKANLAVEEAKLISANAELAEAQQQYDAKQRELDEVQAKLDTAMANKQALVDDANRCQRKMDNASTLISGLSGERIRWTAQSESFKHQTDCLVGDVLILTGFLSYAGPFNQEYRTIMLKQWETELKNRRIPCSDDLSIIGQLTDPATVAEWNLEGLPNDDLSTQNGIIVTKASRYPLLIDPQSQGKNWIKKKEKNNELIVTSLNHKYFRNHLEDALSMGRPLLIENIGEELDPALDNVLEKNFIKSGTTLKVKLGDKEVDVVKTFQLYMTTKLGNPTYTPEISARTSIIDFTVTMKGLEDQLLGRVIGYEKQELELEKTRLVESVTGNKRRIKELEDNLLYKLTSTQGSLVEDESLIAVLTNTKETAAKAHKELTVAAETEAKINDAREEFRPVATRGSILYFLICEMSMVNGMYQTSLNQFLGLFDHAMAESEPSPISQRRIAAIIEALNYVCFKYTCRGLYENDKLLFTLQMALKIDINRRMIRPEEFQMLIKGGAALDLNNVTPKPAKWISDITWLNLVALSQLPNFSQIVNQIIRDEKSWRIWFEKEAPEEETIPDGYTSLDSFRKLLLIRCWCPDRTVGQARKYISQSLGARYTAPVILNLEEMWVESNSHVPLVNILSTGSDPTPMIEALAKKHNLPCTAVSMGQGQEIHARRLMAAYIADGGWVLLQNCHLCLDFMEEVVGTVIDADPVHKEFRMWVTTEPHPKFPISLLQISIKFTNEPPQGIKAGLKRTYAGITQELLDYTNYPQWRPLLYGVSFLHTVVQERRKFGPLGWNIPYEFNQADWSASVQFVENHLDDIDPKRGVSWITIRYMISEVQYGGRVTDDFDKRLLVTFAKVWFADAMFGEQFNFYTGYTIPKSSKHHEVMNFINELPSIDAAQAYGLHPNADITYQTNTTTELLDMILAIQPKDSGAGGAFGTSVYRQVEEMVTKVPHDYVPHEVKSRLQAMGPLNPMNIFLRQELDRMQKVITVVRRTLTDLLLAIDGTIIMNENLRDAMDSITDAKVPGMWRKVSWQSATIGFWFTELIERNGQYRSWVFEGRPKVFWMAGFFNPQGFLTAMQQEVTRAHKGWSLDNVIPTNEVTKLYKEDVKDTPAEGVLVHGLFLEGAGWDKKNSRLVESVSKVLYVKLPVVHIYATNNLQIKESEVYRCPVYKKPSRTDLNYITQLSLRTAQVPEHWVLRGVALLCDTT